MQLDSRQFPIEAFSVFLGYQFHHLSRSSRSHFVLQESVFAAMHFSDLGTFDTRKVHLSTIPPLTARAIYPPGWTSACSLRNKGISRIATFGMYPPSSFFLAESSERLAFHFRFSFARPSHRASWHGVLQDVFYFDPVKGVDVFCANVRYTGTTPSSPR